MVTEKNTNHEKDSSPDDSEKKPEAPVEKKKRDPIRFWTGLTLAFCVAFFVWHLLSDKYTPYSSNGRVEAFVVPIAPQVSGTLTRVFAHNNQKVVADQYLAIIDPAKYELNVRRAQAELQQASQTSGADVAAVSTAQAKVAEADANLRNAEVKGARIIKLSKQGATSMSRADDARTRIEANKASLASARSELEKAKSNLGVEGRDNARIRTALVALETAELDLHRTNIRAPSEGVITNLTVDVGQFANTGSPIMTFISTKDVWIQADMRENSLGHVKQDDPVELVLDAAPGQIFNGEVMSVGYGVSDDTSNSLGGLTTVQTSQGWLRQAQHFPVFIRFTDDSAK
ncbi:MAG: HlyD family secretion protein, partial [Deltaproteobacteria bacterium]|nr:HlyD family secretion protein [Deltaproteobacteria bacterium]